MYQAQQNATDQTSNFFWLLAIIAGAILAVWFFARQWYITPIYYFRYYELVLCSYALEAWDKIAAFMPHWMHLPYGNPAKLEMLKKYALTADPKHVTYTGFSTLNGVVGKWMSWVMSPILIIVAAILYFFLSNRKFTKSYSMKSLRDAECVNWPEITPILSLDLVKEDIEVGPWAMAKTPLDFCKEHEMISPITVNQRQVWKLDKGTAHQILTMQVGPVWTGAQDLPIYMQALAIIFIARAERERDVANKFLAQISQSAAGGKLDFAGVKELMDSKYFSSRIIRWLEQRHAYVYTMMASLLEIARSDGVLASSEFLWLKPVDRRLWYVLNTIGRQTSVVEVAGAHAHWLTERKIGRALRTPMVTEAVKALESSMLDTLYIGKGDSWHTLNVA
jgi:intracellular multiplication protein IcmP